MTDFKIEIGIRYWVVSPVSMGGIVAGQLGKDGDIGLCQSAA